MQRSEVSFILKNFVIWRVALFFVAFLSQYFIPVFGARFPYYDTALQITKLPNWIWGFGNFDGVHYLRLAQDGYQAAFSQAFFPLYPLLIRFLNIFPKVVNLDIRTFVDPSYFATALIISNLFLAGFLFVFYKLMRLDYSEGISKKTLIIALAFPTAFYFGAIYTESLFLLLTVSAIYLFRTKKYFWAGLAAALASATRIFGILIFLVFLFENKESIKKTFISFLMAPVGLAAFLVYLWKSFGNPLLFLTSQPGFGAGRSGIPIISLPRVFYRYLKILVTVNWKTLPYLNAFLEFVFTLIPLGLLGIFYKRVRLSYLIFAALVLILPSATGTFSSMPRYALAAFPIFPLLAEIFSKKFKLLVGIFIIIQVVLLSMFIRGYWVA